MLAVECKRRRLAFFPVDGVGAGTGAGAGTGGVAGGGTGGAASALMTSLINSAKAPTRTKTEEGVRVSEAQPPSAAAGPKLTIPT